jgi:NADPH:quinone reductase-like Zn-dependent oxidoreductase
MLNSVSQLNTGDWIVQTAPLGSVGRCILQIARSRGIRTINVVRDRSERQNVLGIGGDVVVEIGCDLSKRALQGTGGRAAVAAFDAVAGPGTQALADCLVEGGRVVTYGMLSGEPCVMAPEQAIFKNIQLQGFWLSKVLNRLGLQERTKLYDSICDEIRAGKLHVGVDSVYSITKFSEALKRAEQRGRCGKVLVTFDNHFVPQAGPASKGFFECN